MIKSAALLVPVLVASLGGLPLASAQAPASVTIDVDGRAPAAPLEPVWAYYGYDEVNYTTTPEGLELLRTLAQAHTAPVRIRTHFLFNTGDGTPTLKWGSTNLYTEDPAGMAVYDTTLIDQIMDATVQAGVLPLVEIGFMPQALSTEPDPYENSNTYVLDGGCFHPPRDYEKWGALVRTWARHVKDRYPNVEQTWQWELWNEPDIAYWQGSFEEYTRLYDVTQAALHEVLPRALLGGPAVARPAGPFLADFLEHCANGINAVSGQTGTRLDMVTFHAKGGVLLENGHVQMDLGNQLSLHRSGFAAVANSEKFAQTPVVISEADPDGCAACPVSTVPHHAYRNSPAYGAYEVAMMKRSLDLSAELGVELRGVLTWAFTFPGSPYFAGYRALATNGIHLPVLNAFKLLGRLSGDRLPVTSSGARPLAEILEGSVRAEPDVDALAVRDGDQIQILIWNYHDDLVQAEPAPVELSVMVPPAFEAKAIVTHTRVDHEHGNAFSVWESQGSPAVPSAEQLAELQAAMHPAAMEPARPVNVAGGMVNLSFDLPRFGISLVTLTPSSESERELSAGGAGCSCRLLPVRRAPGGLLLAALFGVALLGRRLLRRAATVPPRRLSFLVLLLSASTCRVYDSSLLESTARGSSAGGEAAGSTLTASSDAGGATSSSTDGVSGAGAEVTSDTSTTGQAESSGSGGATSAGGSGGSGAGSGGDAGSEGTTTGGGSGGSSDSTTTGAGGCESDDCCPDDPDKTAPGQCGCDMPDTDDDADGTANCIDECPDDPGKIEVGECGCGMPDEDTVQEAGCVGLKAGLAHRYSFDDEGAQAVDSQGGADAEVAGTTLDGSGQFVLSSESVEQYATLPQGILSSLTNASIEAWFTWDGGPMWTRLFDFGNTVEGMPGERGTGETSLVFSPNGSAEPGFPYAGFSLGDAETLVSCAINTALTTGAEHHVVLSVDASLDTLTLYIDGALACATAMSTELSQLEDVNCWIGRSQFTTDTGFSGSLEEFRIYDVALTAEQVSLSFDSGPEPDFL